MLGRRELDPRALGCGEESRGVGRDEIDLRLARAGERVERGEVDAGVAQPREHARAFAGLVGDGCVVILHLADRVGHRASLRMAV